MPATHEKLIEIITKLTNDHWANTKEALLLSKLGPLLADVVDDYKATLSGASLRGFIMSHASSLKIAQHSEQYAKVGVYPADQVFSFETEKAPAQVGSGNAEQLRSTRRAFHNFIAVLSKLPSEDIEDVHIPTRVIVRLLEGK